MYFDNAATSFPKPETVYRAVDRALREGGGNAGRSGHRGAVEASRILARARARLAQLINAPDPQRIVWTQNCTHALNLALKGVLRPGDRLVTTQLEHNSIARPLRSLEKAGVEVTRVPCPGGHFDIRAFLEAVRPGTRMVALLHASNVTGEVLPAAELGAFSRSRGVLFLLDAAQTAGSRPLDVREIGADLVAMPGHKGLYGPPGTGALYVGEGVELAPLIEGGTGSVSEQDEQPERLPDRLESGTQNVPGIAGLDAGIEWILQTGVETIRRREEALVAQLWSGLREIPGVTLYGPAPGTDRAAVVSFNLEGWDPNDAAAVLEESFDIQCRPGLHCAPWAHRSLGSFPAGTIRLSPGYFNTEAEVEAVVRAAGEMSNVKCQMSNGL
jgi:cysteine desulfurase family protein